MAEKKAVAWYKTGKAGREMAKQEDAAAQARREQRGPMRFYLKSDTSCKITFLDTPEFFIREHNLKIGGKYFNYFTCLREFDTCPCCEEGDHPSTIVVGSIIAHNKWTDKEGKVHQNQKMLFVAKGKARQVLERKIEKRDGDLTGCVFEMSRGTTSTECSTGEDFEYLKTIDVKLLMKLAPKDKKGQPDKDYIKPFNYEELFAPKAASEIRRIIGVSAPVGSEGDEPEEDEIPTWDELEEMGGKALKKLIKSKELDVDPDDHDEVDDLRKAVAEELGVKPPKKGKKEEKKETAKKGKKGKKEAPEEDGGDEDGEESIDDLL